MPGKRAISNDAGRVKSVFIFVFIFLITEFEHTSSSTHELRLFLPLLSAVKPSPHCERPISVTGIIDEPLVSGIRRLLWIHSRIRVMVLGEANDAFGNNAA